MIAMLFPGQGSQRPGMLAELRALPGGEATVVEACDVLGRDLFADDGDAVMSSTAAAQRALLVTGVASMRAIEALGIRVDAVAGHSVGAFAAAVACGALAFRDALRLVDARGTAMERRFPSGYGMAAVTGLSEGDVAEIARSASRNDDSVYAANVNAPDQILLAGQRDAVTRALESASRKGARTRWLSVDVPAHTVLLEPVARELERLFATIDVRDARSFYATNASARTVRDATRIRDDLIESVARPVRWDDATRALYERGVRLFLEARPGAVLSDLASRAFADARCVSLESSSLETIGVLASIATRPGVMP